MGTQTWSQVRPSPITPTAHTGVSWVDGELHRIDPHSGEVLESLELPAGVNVSGLESDGADQFFCGVGKTGKLRAARRPKRGG